MRISDTGDIWTCELGVGIMDGATILTEADRDGIISLCMITLAGEYHSFSGDRHLVNESLISEGIDDTIERCEIHPVVSLANKLFLQICEGDAGGLPEFFDETFARQSDARDSHRRKSEEV